MSMPTPEERSGEAFTEAAAEAVQTSVMAFRLVMAIADAVRRQQQKRAGKEDELPDAEKAAAEASEEVKKFLPVDIAAALLQGADWPQLAQQLMALKRAGVDLETMLPRVGEITVTVRDQVVANAEKVAREGTEEWAKALRETLPAGPVREAILSSPAWPEMARTMATLNERGVDVRAILGAAHEEGVGVDQAIAKVLSAAEVPTTSRDATLSYGPLTVGLDIPRISTWETGSGPSGNCRSHLQRTSGSGAWCGGRCPGRSGRRTSCCRRVSGLWSPRGWRTWRARGNRSRSTWPGCRRTPRGRRARSRRWGGVWSRPPLTRCASRSVRRRGRGRR
ncbi:hypothetical protein SFUMM280S_00935 [Streptomyces fumanus]